MVSPQETIAPRNVVAKYANTKVLFLLFVALPTVTLGGTTNTGQLPQAQRPAAWATPLQKPGLPNLHRVSSVLYRGAQPSREGMLQLEQMGVKTVVDLRGFHDDTDKLPGTKLSCVTIRFYTWHPEDDDMVRFLKTVTDINKQPVFVHCERGIDRTGTMVAVYRMAVQGWSKDEAIREMTQGGFGYDNLFPNLVAYLKALDVATLQKKAGIVVPGKD
jgi:protein tyrosine/serine phosphatase